MTAPDGVEIRPATVGDAEAGARLHRTCWREAYGPITDPALLTARLGDEANWVDRWRRQIEGGPQRLLAVVGDELVGFGTAGPGRHDEGLPAHELYALYVRSAWHGTGVGAALLVATLGDAAAYLWVLEDNARARAFYARHGFAPDGVEKLYDELDARELRMVRPWTSGSSTG